MEAITQLKDSLDIINYKISKIQDKEKNSYTSQVLKSFPLGMVGGSGRNNNALNKRRSNELNKTIDNANVLTSLYSEQSDLERKIKYIESGQKAKDEERKISRAEAMAIYWKNLKPGDTLQIGRSDGGNPIILKKSLKSCITQSGCKWTALEIIGKEAIKFL